VIVWIVVGIVVASLVFLALAALPVLRRLPGLDRALRRLRRRVEQAQGLQARATDLERQVAATEASAQRVQEGLAAIQAQRQRRAATGRG
jgi:hypothetical protein